MTGSQIFNGHQVRPTCRVGSFFLFCLLLVSLSSCQFATAQIQTTAETRYRVDGIPGFQIVEDVVFAPKDSQPHLVAVGWISIDSEAAIVRIKAEDLQRKRLEVKQFTSTEFAILGSGRIWVDVTAVDFEKQVFEQDSFVIDVDPLPEPEPPEPEPDNPDPDNPDPDNPDPDNPDPPEPDDSIPADKFDNLGRRIDASADAANLQLDLRKRHAEIYATVANQMERRELVRSSDAKFYVQNELAKLTRGPEWNATFAIITESAGSLSPMAWADLILWYRAVAAGLSG